MNNQNIDTSHRIKLFTKDHSNQIEKVKEKNPILFKEQNNSIKIMCHKTNEWSKFWREKNDSWSNSWKNKSCHRSSLLINTLFFFYNHQHSVPWNQTGVRQVKQVKVWNRCTCAKIIWYAWEYFSSMCLYKVYSFWHYFLPFHAVFTYLRGFFSLF